MTTGTPPPSAAGRRLVVEADGGSRGNPGVAGYGALVKDAETGAVLAERAAPLGKRSNNVAEYRGLIAGLESVLRIEPGARVEVRMDSKLVIEQMAGRWKIKHEDMRALALEARDLVRQLQAAGGSVRWTWIPREVNKAADKLSNDGMDGLTVDRLLSGTTAETVSATSSPAPEPVPAAVPGPVVAPGRSLKVEAWTGSVRLAGPVRILLVRHGSTALTTQGRLSGGGGLSDPPLDGMGEREAEGAARVVAACLAAGRAQEDPAPRVVTSALARTRETGAVVTRVVEGVVGVGVEPVVDDAWDEQGFGVWDGLGVDQIRRRWPQAWSDLTDPAVEPDHQRPPLGESNAELTARIRTAVTGLAQEPGDVVVVVTSRRPILALLALALGLPLAAVEAFGVDPGSVTAVEVRADGRVSVPFVNRTGAGAAAPAVPSSGA